MSAPRKGWYADPEGTARERFWDGAQWQPMTRVPRALRPPLWRSQKILAVVLAAAVVVAVVSLVTVLGPMAGAFTGSSVDSPTTIVRHLDAGRYTLFEAVGSSRSAGPVWWEKREPTSVGPEDMSVTDPAGQRVVVAPRSVGETISRGSTTFVGVGGFTAETDGLYTIEVGGAPSEVLLTRTLFDTSATALVTLGVAAFLGGTAAVVLFVLMLVRASRRRAVGGSSDLQGVPGH